MFCLLKSVDFIETITKKKLINEHHSKMIVSEKKKENKNFAKRKKRTKNENANENDFHFRQVIFRMNALLINDPMDFFVVVIKDKIEKNWKKVLNINSFATFNTLR